MRRYSILISAFVFLLFAAVHAYRLYKPFQVIVAGTIVPLWISGVVAAVAALLSLGLFLSLRK